MRVALARALFLRPHLLLLDEPTNHLDLDACVWLEEELKTYKRILVMISHSQDFLNGVCTNIIHLDKKRLKNYGVSYEPCCMSSSPGFLVSYELRCMSSSPGFFDGYSSVMNSSSIRPGYTKW